MVEVILSNRLTMSKNVDEFEVKFAQWLNVPYACMVNSGSSANLLAMAALVNPERKKRLFPGDEVLVPCVCWSTSVFPIMQCGLRPVLVDCDPDTMNMSVADFRAKITPKTKGVVLVHVLGNSPPMKSVMALVEKHELLVMEDTCESLGSKVTIDESYKGAFQYLGTFGEFGTFSFYYSHHMTTGEGGAVICHNEDDYNLLRCLRAHGWSRHRTDMVKLDRESVDVDSRFNFVNIGYNLRPMEVQAAMGKLQLDNLAESNEIRRVNFQKLRRALLGHKKFKQQFSIMKATEGCDPAWFGLAILLDAKYKHQLSDLLSYLENKGIENRPIVTGNIARQKCLPLFGYDFDPSDYPGAEIIHTRGFFLGSHNKPIDEQAAAVLANIIFAFAFTPSKRVLITGGSGLVGSSVKMALTADANWQGAKILSLSSSMCDLRVWSECEDLFKKFCPTHVIHLAAVLAGTHEMSKHQATYFMDNSAINRNVLKAAEAYGVTKVVSCLSTAIFPANTTYPIDESRATDGPVHPLSAGYGGAKRELLQISKWFSENSKTNFVCLIPSNIYGANGSFNGEQAPFVHAFIRKCVEAKVNKRDTIDCFGTGDTRRQILFSKDLARFICWSLAEYNDSNEPLIVAGMEMALDDVMSHICKAVGFCGEINWTGGQGGGPTQRTASTAKLEKLYGDLKFCSFENGVKETLEYYLATRSGI